MNVSDQELLHDLSRMPVVDAAGLVMIKRETQVAVHRGLAGLLGVGFAHRNQSLITWLTWTGHRAFSDVLSFCERANVQSSGKGKHFHLSGHCAKPRPTLASSASRRSPARQRCG